MANTHERLKQAVSTAIENLYGDTTVGKVTTYEDLQEIMDDVEMKMEALDL